MKIITTMFATVTILVICFLFLFSGTNNAGSKVSKSSVSRIQSYQSNSEFKRRDYIRERRENKRKEKLSQKNTSQTDTGSHYKDFMAYSRQGNNGTNHDDFR